MRGRLRRNALTVALAAALVLSSFYLAGGLSAFRSFVPTVHFIRPVGAPVVERYGTLSIDALLGIKETYYAPARHQLDLLSPPTYFKPIGAEKVSISLSNSPQTTPLILATNASGLIRANLPVSNDYVGTISDPRFHVTIPFSILANTTTSIVVKAVRQSYAVLYDEVYDDGTSGVSPTTQVVFLKLHPTDVFSNSSLSVFLERSSTSAKNFIDPSSNSSVTQTPAKILTESKVAGALWAEITTERTGDRLAASQLSLVTYIPVYTEAIGPG